MKPLQAPGKTAMGRETQEELFLDTRYIDSQVESGLTLLKSLLLS